MFVHFILKNDYDVFVGPEKSGTCDISNVKSGIPEEATFAINVKLSLENELNRLHEITPENQVVLNGGKAFVLLIMPRLRYMALFPMDGKESMTLSAKKGIKTSPETLVRDLEQFLPRKQTAPIMINGRKSAKKRILDLV